MDAARRRFFLWLSVFALFAGTGTVHRLWVRHWVAKAEASSQTDALKFKEQIERVREEFDRLPPEGKSFVKEVLQAQHGDLVGTPILMKLSRMAPKGQEDATLEQKVLAGAQAVGRLWCGVETWLARGLWVAGLLLLAVGSLGVVLGQGGWLAFGAKASWVLADQWLLWLSLGAALAFALLGGNPWRGMPISFYAAPGVLLFGAFMLQCQQERPADSVLEDTLAALSAPLASFLLVFGLGFIG